MRDFFYARKTLLLSFKVLLLLFIVIICFYQHKPNDIFNYMRSSLPKNSLDIIRHIEAYASHVASESARKKYDSINIESFMFYWMFDDEHFLGSQVNVFTYVR